MASHFKQQNLPVFTGGQLPQGGFFDPNFLSGTNPQARRASFERAKGILEQRNGRPLTERELLELSQVNPASLNSQPQNAGGGFNFQPLIQGGISAGIGALAGGAAGLNPLVGAGLGVLGGQALGGNSSAQRLALGLGPIALAQNAADKRLDAIPGGFSTPFSTVQDGTATIDPSIRSGQQDLLTGLQGNENRFIQARVRPFERQAARQRANISQGLQRRGLGGSSLATNELARFEGQVNPLIADQQALATNESLQAQNQLLNQRFNQELAALGLGAQDIQLLTQQAQLKTDLLGRTIDATGRILSPGTQNISGGAAGAPQQGGGIGDFISGGIDKAIGGITDFFGGDAAAGAGLGLVSGLTGPGASAGLGIGEGLGFGAGATGTLASAAPGFGAELFGPSAGLSNLFSGSAGSLPGFGPGLANGAQAFGAPAGFEGLFQGGGATGGAAGAAPSGGIFAGAGGAALAGGGIAAVTALIRGQGIGQAAAQGGGAAAGAAAGFAVAGPPGAIIGGILGSLGGGALGKKLGISARGGGENKADWSASNTGAGNISAGDIKASSAWADNFGLTFGKHISIPATQWNKALEGVATVDNAISQQLTPEENAAMKAQLAGASVGVGRNSNEGGFSPSRLAGTFYTNRDSALQSVLTPQRYQELGLGAIFSALKTGDENQINQAFGVA